MLLPEELNFNGCVSKREVLNRAKEQLPECAIAYFLNYEGKELCVQLPAKFPVKSDIEDVASTSLLLEKRYYPVFR